MCEFEMGRNLSDYWFTTACYPFCKLQFFKISFDLAELFQKLDCVEIVNLGHEQGKEFVLGLGWVLSWEMIDKNYRILMDWDLV